MPCGKFNELLPFTSHSFPIHSRGKKSFMQANRRPQSYVIWVTFNTMTGLWSCGCAVSPARTKSTGKISCMQLDDLARVLRTRQHRWHGHVERSDSWLKKLQKLNPAGGCGHGCPKKTWTNVIGMHCLSLRPTLLMGKLGSGRLENDVRQDTP